MIEQKKYIDISQMFNISMAEFAKGLGDSEDVVKNSIDNNISKTNDVILQKYALCIGGKMKNIIKRKDGRWYGRKQLFNNIIGVYARTQEECRIK